LTPNEYSQSLADYTEKKKVEVLLKDLTVKILIQKPAMPLLYLYQQMWLGQEKNEKIKSIMECYFELSYNKRDFEYINQNLIKIFLKLCPQNITNDMTMTRGRLIKLVQLLLFEIPENVTQCINDKLNEEIEEPINYEQFEMTITMVLNYLKLIEDFKDSYETKIGMEGKYNFEDLNKFLDNYEDQTFVKSLTSRIEKNQNAFEDSKANCNQLLLFLIQRV